MASYSSSFTPSSYPYVDDRTFLSSIQYLLEREMDDMVQHGEALSSRKYQTMKFARNKIIAIVGSRTLPPVAQAAAAAMCEDTDPLLGTLNPAVTRFVEAEIRPNLYCWGHFLEREINDLLAARATALRVKIQQDSERKAAHREAIIELAREVIFGRKRNHDEDDEEAAWVEQARRRFAYCEVSDLDDDEEEETGDDDDDDDDEDDVQFNRTDSGVQLVSHQVERNEEENTKTTTTTTFTIGSKRVKEEEEKEKEEEKKKKDQCVTPVSKKARIVPNAPKKNKSKKEQDQETPDLLTDGSSGNTPATPITTHKKKN